MILESDQIDFLLLNFFDLEIKIKKDQIDVKFDHPKVSFFSKIIKASIQIISI